MCYNRESNHDRRLFLAFPANPFPLRPRPPASHSEGGRGGKHTDHGGFGDSHRGLNGARALRKGGGCAALSREHDEDDDMRARHRGGRSLVHPHREPHGGRNGRYGGRRRRSLRARGARRRDDAALGQRRRRRHCRRPRRLCRQLRRAHEREGEGARREEHALRQSERPAESCAHLDGARHRTHRRLRHEESEVPLLRRRERARDHLGHPREEARPDGEHEPPPRHIRGRDGHQDGLHERGGRLPRGLGAARRRRADRRCPRRGGRECTLL